MERNMLNITYNDRITNFWVRERTNVIDIIGNVRKGRGPGHDIPTTSKTTDGPHMSPLEDDTIRKDHREDQPNGGYSTWTNTGWTR